MKNFAFSIGPFAVGVRGGTVSDIFGANRAPYVNIDIVRLPFWRHAREWAKKFNRDATRKFCEYEDCDQTNEDGLDANGFCRDHRGDWDGSLR